MCQYHTQTRPSGVRPSRRHPDCLSPSVATVRPGRRNPEVSAVCHYQAALNARGLYCSEWLAGWGPIPTMAAVSRPLTKAVACPIWMPEGGSSSPIAFATWGRKIGAQ